MGRHRVCSTLRRTELLLRAPVVLALILFVLLPSAWAEAPKGYERLTRAQVLEAVERASTAGGRADFYSKDLSDLDLSGVDFKGANLTAAVLNGSNLSRANLSRCNLTVAFAEGTNLSGADLTEAVLFSTQLKRADLRNANLSRARLIGDLTSANLSGANFRQADAAADMRNQSMGLMRANFISPVSSGRTLRAQTSPRPTSASPTSRARI